MRGWPQAGTPTSFSLRRGTGSAWLRLHGWTLLVLLATLVGAGLRLATLDQRSLWDDELISVNIAKAPFAEILRARLHVGADRQLVDRLYTNNPPLHLLVIHATRSISTGDWAMRLPFAIAGIATIPVSFFVVKRLFDQRLAGVTTVLMSLSQIGIVYSQEARPSSLLMLFSLCALLSLLRALESNRRSDWGIFVLFLLLDCWSSYFAIILVVPTLALVVCVHLTPVVRGGGYRLAVPVAKKAAFSFMAVGIACIPLSPDLLYVAAQNDVTGGQTPSLLRTFLLTVILPVLLVVPNLTTPFLLTSLLPLMLMLVGMAQLAIRRRQTHAIALLWMLTPLAILLFIDSSHFVHPKYVLFALPMLIPALLCGIDYLIWPLRRFRGGLIASKVYFLLVGVMVAGYLAGIVTYAQGYSNGGAKKSDWRGVAREYERHATAESCLVVVDVAAVAATRSLPYYLTASLESCWIDVRHPELRQRIESYRDLWWVVEERTNFENKDDIDLLISVFEPTHEIWRGYGLLLLHSTNAVDPATSLATARSTLQLMTETLQPALDPDSSHVSAARQGLANLLALGGDAAAAATLLNGAKTITVNDGQYGWQYALRDIERGDFESARWWAVRLIATYPAAPEVYELMAEIQTRAGSPTADRYYALARRMRPQ
jgi:4-amino-4-deoxy-L-arabinose transferase-like glycosyltransferase